MKGTVALLLVALVASAAAKHLPEQKSPIAVKRFIVAPPEDEVAIPEKSEVKVEEKVVEGQFEVENKKEVEVEVEETEKEVEVEVEETEKEVEVEVEETEKEEEVKLDVEEEEEIILWLNGCPLNHKIHWLTADVLDCSRFYQCVWGHKVAMQCPEPLHFNPHLQVCDWPHAAGCAIELFPEPIIPIQRVLPKNA